VGKLVFCMYKDDWPTLARAGHQPASSGLQAGKLGDGIFELRSSRFNDQSEEEVDWDLFGCLDIPASGSSAPAEVSKERAFGVADHLPCQWPLIPSFQARLCRGCGAIR
jgi:hypothetical protein